MGPHHNLYKCPATPPARPGTSSQQPGEPGLSSCSRRQASRSRQAQPRDKYQPIYVQTPGGQALACISGIRGSLGIDWLVTGQLLVRTQTLFDHRHTTCFLLVPVTTSALSFETGNTIPSTIRVTRTLQTLQPFLTDYPAKTSPPNNLGQLFVARRTSLDDPEMADDQEHEGASVKEQLIEACRRNNVELLTEIVENCKSDDEISSLMNKTTTVMGNHLYHEAALQGNYEIIDMLLDQPDFECDPVNRAEGDTPLHSAIRWINSEPPAQREFGNALVSMMLEAGSNPRVKNKAKLTAYQLVDPTNKELRDLISKHEYASLNQGDFVGAGEVKPSASSGGAANNMFAADVQAEDESDDDAEFSGSDDEERAEFERRKAAKKVR
ncbi:hypothetical protein G7054_g12661 [Neopestalotiopsis clavispora]|nr:hypothetical protein G7054_g12661 [Neopestalotiopsis clavispora]